MDPGFQDHGFQDPEFQDYGFQDPEFQDPGIQDPDEILATSDALRRESKGFPQRGRALERPAPSWEAAEGHLLCEGWLPQG